MQAVTLVLSAAVAIFAALQWWVYRGQFKLQLYSRRYDVYLAVRKLLASVVSYDDARDSDLNAFLVGTREHEFLFSRSIGSYIDEINKTALDFQMVKFNCETLPVGAERERNVEEQRRFFDWFEAEHREGAFKRFLPYLDFRNVGGRWAGWPTFVGEDVHEPVVDSRHSRSRRARHACRRTTRGTSHTRNQSSSDAGGAPL